MDIERHFKKYPSLTEPQRADASLQWPDPVGAYRRARLQDRGRRLDGMFRALQKLLHWHGSCKQVPLHGIAAVLDEKLSLRTGLHPLRDNMQFEMFRDSKN